jgi:hypothetical protein
MSCGWHRLPPGQAAACGLQSMPGLCWLLLWYLPPSALHLRVTGAEQSITEWIIDYVLFLGRTVSPDVRGIILHVSSSTLYLMSLRPVV